MSDKTQSTLIRDLGDGLVMRHATSADAETLSEFNAKIHSDEGMDKPDERVRAWTQDLLTKPHPTFQPGDFTIVEETRTSQIVSSMNLISQTWSYDGIPFKLGRPELVGTLPEYRNRGLVRAQFDAIHQWSAERGELVQAITGIPYYYRLFGYEMALDLGGGRIGYAVNVPRLKESEEEPCRIRPATEDDLPFIAEVYQQGSRRYRLQCLRDLDMWRYELSGKSSRNVNRVELRLIEGLDGEALGFFAHPPFTWHPTMGCEIYELKPGASWAKITPSVVRYLFQTGKALAAQEGKEAEFGAFAIWLGQQHPAYQAIDDRLPRKRKPYAYYMRVPDLLAFVQHIKPALEEHLAASIYAGYSGELKITFYRDGLRLGFEQGRISIDAYQPTPVGHSGNAGFPGLTFLQLLFGYRSLEEIAYAFPDCFWENDDACGLLNALFPKRPTDLLAVS